MKKVVVEVGSTCTKFDEFDGKNINRLGVATIQLKKNYKINNCLDENDVKALIENVNKYTKDATDVYICGTSIFRTLNEDEKTKFLTRFKNETGYDFQIIDQEKENELTVRGATRFTKDKVAVFIGGGGSTEIAIYDDKIKEMANSKIGVMDVMNEYEDLANDLASTNIDDVKSFVKGKLNLPKEKADVLILAGGGHKLFALESGISYEENTLYKDDAAPIMMNIESRKNDSRKYFEKISLDEIRSRVDDPKWWYATRAMCAFVLVAAEEIGVKYVVPTDIAMVYGIIDEMSKEGN